MSVCIRMCVEYTVENKKEEKKEQTLMEKKMEKTGKLIRRLRRLMVGFSLFLFVDTISFVIEFKNGLHDDSADRGIWLWMWTRYGMSHALLFVTLMYYLQLKKSRRYFVTHHGRKLIAVQKEQEEDEEGEAREKVINARKVRSWSDDAGYGEEEDRISDSEFLEVLHHTIYGSMDRIDHGVRSRNGIGNENVGQDSRVSVSVSVSVGESGQQTLDGT